MSKRLILSIGAVVLVAAVAIGATYAYFTADTTAANVVTIGNVNIEAVLADTSTKQVTPGQQFPVNRVTVKNRGNNPAYIRIQLRPTADAGNYRDDLIVVHSGGSLALSTDNWYHYKTIVKPGESVDFTGLATLKETVKASDMTGGVRLEYFVEAIQSDHIGLDSQGYPQWPNVEIKEYNH